MPFNADQLMRPPQYWQDQLPNPDDYDTIEEWQAAVESGSYLNSPPLGGYYNPGTDEWIGGRQTEAEYAARKANQMLNPTFNAGLGGMGLRLDSAMQVNPDQWDAAYGAWDEQGNPLVNEVVLSLMEQYGYRPNPIGGAVGGEVPPPNLNEDTGQTDAGRHNEWWNSGTPPRDPSMLPPNYVEPVGPQGPTGNTGGGFTDQPRDPFPPALRDDPFGTFDPPMADPGPTMPGARPMALTANEPVAGIPPDIIARIRARRKGQLRPPIIDPQGYGY